MTCIAGVAHDGKVWIGGDSAGVAGWSLTVRADEKVFRRGPFVFGFTSSFRMGDLLRYAFDPPAQTSRVTDRAYLCTTWVDALRECFKDGGYKKTENGVESGGSFLVGYKGRLYEINEDYQVGLPRDGYGAVGCGHEIAKGSLYTTGHLSPAPRIRVALRAAEHHNAAVRGPFRVVSGAAVA